ncbi:MAG: TolC family protein [Acidobacteriota bacterium]
MNAVKTKRIMLAVCAVLLLAAAGLQAGSDAAARPLELTLEKAVELVKSQNRDVLIADQERYKAESQVREARSGAFPQINVSGSYMRNVMKPVMFLAPGTQLNPTSQTQTFEIGSDNSYAMGASIAQTLYSRKLGTAMEIADTYHSYAEEAYRSATQDAVLAVKRSFYGVMLAQKLVEANRQGLEVAKANYENVRSLYKFGKASEFDLLRAEVQLANTEPSVISSENNLVLALNGLKNLLALPQDAAISVKGEFAYEAIPSQVSDEARRNAVSANPMLAGLALQESMLEKNIDIERANYFPTVALVGSYQWQTQDNTFKWNDYRWAKIMNVGLQLSFPLFDGFRSNARVDEASVDRQKIYYTRLKAEEGLKIQITSAELKMNEAKKRIEGQEKNIAQAEKAVRIAQSRYKNGVGTQFDLLDTQVAMTRTQTIYAQAVYDYLVAKAEWQYAVGLPN